MKLETPVKILVRRRAALGDVVICTGIFRELKRRYSEMAKIDVVTEWPQVFAHNPNINQIFNVNMMPDIADYDIYFNLDDAYELNPIDHTADNYFYRVFGTTDLDKSMELFVDEKTSGVIDQVIKKIDADYICVHMRNWYWDLKNIKSEVWHGVFEQLHEKHPGLKILAVGGNSDLVLDLPYMIDVRSLFQPGDLRYLMDHAKCFVGIDSAPFHIAGASKTGIVALLSHMHPNKVLPFRNGEMGWGCQVVQAQVDCLGCHSRQPRPVRQITCERGDFACNRLWDVDAIVSAVARFL